MLIAYCILAAGLLLAFQLQAIAIAIVALGIHFVLLIAAWHFEPMAKTSSQQVRAGRPYAWGMVALATALVVIAMLRQ